MAILLNLGSIATFMRVKKNNVFDVSQIGRCDRELLAGPEFKDFLSDLVSFNRDLKNEPVYVTLSSGCGVIYKTLPIALESVLVNGSRTTSAEMQEQAFEIVKERLPFGLQGEYVPAIMNEYKTDTDYILACAYIPKDVLDNILRCFVELKISLMDVLPCVYGVYKSLDTNTFKQIVVNMEDELLLVNGLGMIPWSKPTNFNEEVAFDFLVNQSQQFYSYEPKVAETSMVDISRLDVYMYTGFKCSGAVDAGVAAAFGLLHTAIKKKAAGSESAKKGGFKDVVEKLRLVLNGKTEE